MDKKTKLKFELKELKKTVGELRNKDTLSRAKITRLEKEKEKLEKDKKKILEKKEKKQQRTKKIEEHNFLTSYYNKIIDKLKPTSTMLVEMYHHNGTVSHFIGTTKMHKFFYKGLPYIVDEEKKVYNNTTKLYMLRYHQGYALPFSIDVSANEMKEASSKDDLQQISTSFNPYVLKDVLKMEYAKGVIQGAEVHEFIKRSFLISIITLVTLLVFFLVTAYKSGWLG